MPQTFPKASISTEAAHQAIAAAEATAAEIGTPMDIAIVDDSGVLKAFSRMDGAPTGIDRLVIFGGGYPIKVDGQLVGAIGVSGGHYTEDQQVAEAGLAALGVQAG